MINLASAWTLLSWAREDTRELKTEIDRFLDGSPYSQVIDFDPETGNKLLKLEFTQVPDRVRKLASHVVWDLKHCLDHATHAVVREVRGVDPGDLHFPWSTHPNDLRRKLNHVRKGETDPRYPVELHPFFDGLEPYPTGNGYPGGSDELLALSKLANTTKHAVALTVAPISQVAHFKTIAPVIRMWPNRWEADKKQLVIAELPPDGKGEIDLQIASYIGFSDVPAFEGYDAAHVLTQLVEGVRTMLTEFEQAAFAIMRTRG